MYSTESLQDIGEILREHGVCILRNYFGDADRLFKEIKQWLIDIDIGLTEDIKTWKIANMPLGPRYGMYQSIISNAPTFFEVRERMIPIFEHLFETDDLICSLDGASIYPPKRDSIRWPHIDQTKLGFFTYQGQAVLTDTTASFMCTPGSHLKHEEIMNVIKSREGAKLTKQWYKFTDEDKEVGEIADIEQHIPIIAPKGSVILWDSRLIHSAKRQEPEDDSWRCTLYVCMRPRDTCTKRNINTIRNALKKGRTTNHLASRIFPIGLYRTQKNDKVKNLLKNLSSLSQTENLSSRMLELFGYLPDDPMSPRSLNCNSAPTTS